MDGILQLLRRVAAFVLLSACVDFLMPDGNWRAYVRFASVYRQFKDTNTFMEELKNLLK